jgi:glucose/mannose-6-phosphate isomerase
MSFSEDKSNYEKVILEFPRQLQQGIDLVGETKIEGIFSAVAVCGMGASSMATELLSAVVPGTQPLWAVRQYNLPREITDRTLVIASSYSGNTEETIACYEDAKQKQLALIGVTRGGRLGELCRRDRIPMIEYPEPTVGFQPRWGFGLSFAVLGKILENHDILPGFTAALQKITPALTAKVSKELRTNGEAIAKALFKKVPAVYSSQKLSHLARIWQIDINEDAKTPASWNYFPEANHYETTGYSQNSDNRVAVMLRDSDDHPRIKQRMEITARLLQEKGIATVFADIPSGHSPDTLISAILSGKILSMWTCYYLAKMSKIDPAPTEMVEKLKKMLL